MWDNRQLLLSQALNYQMFQRDARQADSILNQQENFLTKVEQPVSASTPSLANLTIFSHNHMATEPYTCSIDGVHYICIIISYIVQQV